MISVESPFINLSVLKRKIKTIFICLCSYITKHGWMWRGAAQHFFTLLLITHTPSLVMLLLLLSESGCD